MSSVDAEKIRDLRHRTGAGMLDCKVALSECGGDFDKAIDFLKKKGLASALKKTGRVAKEGRVHSYIHGPGKVGVLLEVNCETDFVANTDEFKALAHDLAMHIAACSPQYLSREFVPASALEVEEMNWTQEAEKLGKPANVVAKMVEGKRNKWYSEVCLLDQPFVKDPAQSVTQMIQEGIARLGENVLIRRYVRFQLGEDLLAQKTEESQKS